MCLTLSCRSILQKSQQRITRRWGQINRTVMKVNLVASTIEKTEKREAVEADIFWRQILLSPFVAATEKVFWCCFTGDAFPMVKV